MVDDIPRVLASRYEVGSLIGRGGMAEVHIGRDNRLGRTVAIKILRSDLARDPSFQARFRREAQSAASLNHPAIVSVYDTGDDVVESPDGSRTQVPFIVMEYVEGHTVRDLLRDGSALPIDEAIEITTGVLAALEYSHQASIVHRDIKPANVMLTPTGAVKVMDFGIARAMADASSSMTQTQAVIGTAQYLSPEQARGEVVDTRSDLYSAGCLLYELLTGRPPFQGDSAVSVAYQHVSEQPQPPSVIAPDVPEALDRIVLKALTKDRDHRYSTASEFRADLEAAARNEGVSAPAIAAAGAGAGTAATQVFNDGAGAAASAEPQGSSFDEVVAGEEEADEPRSNKALIWILLVIGLLTAAAIAFLVWDRSGATETATVPDLSGLDEAGVEQALAAEGLEPDFAYEADNEVEEGLAVSWDPETGTEIEVSEEQPGIVEVIISTGPEAVVPDLSDMSEQEARAALADEGLDGDFTFEPHDEIPDDTTISWEPETGTAMAEGETVEVLMSSGPDAAEIPDVQGMPQTAARNALEAAGFDNVRTETRDEPGVAADTAIETDPAAGENVGLDTQITLVLGTGNVELRNMEGESLEDFEEHIRELGLSARVRDQEDPGEPGLVLSQDQSGIVPHGTTVTVYVSVEPPPEPTPPDDDDDEDDDENDENGNGDDEENGGDDEGGDGGS